MRISAGTTRPLTSTEASHLVNERYGCIISNRVAITIATWYQAPEGNGSVFAELAATGMVDFIDLLEAIRVERATADDAANMALDMLLVWACFKRLMNVGIRKHY